MYAERSFLFVDVISYFSATHDTNNIFTRAFKIVDSYKQGSRLTAALFAMLLFRKAWGCLTVYEKKYVRSLFARGLNESVGNSMLVYLVQYPRTSLTELACYTDTLIMITNGGTASNNQSKYSFGMMPERPHKSSSYAVAKNEKVSLALLTG